LIKYSSTYNFSLDKAYLAELVDKVDRYEAMLANTQIYMLEADDKVKLIRTELDVEKQERRRVDQQ
jgi:hypothetical protein